MLGYDCSWTELSNVILSPLDSLFGKDSFRMAQNAKNDVKSQNLYDLFQQTHNDALRRNEEHAAQCFARYNEYLTLKQQLDTLPEKLTHEVMVPIGNRALMRGKLVHTNEILVHLGDGWFVKQSAKLAAEICYRRIASHADMLEKLETERNLLVNNKQLPIAEQAFGNEIVEQYDEKTEAEWRVRHRQKEKTYRQKLASERSDEKSEKRDTDDDEFWEKLERLELQEELEEELEKMKGKREQEHASPPVLEDKKLMKLEESQVSPPVEMLATEKDDSAAIKVPARRISFGEKQVLSFKTDHTSEESGDSSDDEPLRIEFSHTKYQEPSNRTTDATDTITSPADIYKLFPKPQLKSILKQNTNYSEIENSVKVKPPSGLPPSFISYDYIEEEADEAVAFGEVVERKLEVLEPVKVTKSITEAPRRPISRFKASRKC